jgi:hypothetical protein
MDYGQIVLQGYFDENNRSFLIEYFVREFKKAEKENYTSNVFFNGCLSSLSPIKEQLTIKFNKRKLELSLIINNIKLNLKNGNIYDGIEEVLISAEEELNTLKESDFFTSVQLVNSQYMPCQFNLAKIEFIEHSINEASKQTNAGNDVLNLIDLSKNKGADKVIMLEKLGILDFLRSKEPFNLSTNSLAIILSGITGVDSKTLQSYINPIGNDSVVQKNNPMKNEKNVKKITQTLIEIGFTPK